MICVCPRPEEKSYFSSTLDSNGYRYTGEGGSLKVTKGDLVVMKG